MIEKHAIVKEILQSIGLVVFIAIVGDKSDQGEEIVRTIWVFFHFPVHLNMTLSTSLSLQSDKSDVYPVCNIRGKNVK